MTVIGIEKIDGEIIVFRMKGQENIDVLIALDRFMSEALETDVGVAPSEVSGGELPCGRGSCTLAQVAAMARAGFVDEKIEVACSDDSR